MYRLKVLLFAMLVSGFAAAQSSTVYKHVDKDGKVTYSEKPPAKDDAKGDAKSDGSARKIGVDKDRNVIKPLATKAEVEANKVESSKPEDRIDRNARLQADLDAANLRLERAKAALESGKDPRDDEWRTVGVSKGKPARVPTDSYHERVKALEQAVKDAEVAVRQAEIAVRRGVS